MTEKLVHLVNRCDFCGVCVAVCPQDAIDLAEASLEILVERCTLCGSCVQACPVRALEEWDAE
ncbi:MAG TPA: 4Fe-4S binding protein [bacterium]|nr:4Fe-4S binding protein [bacterium]HQG44620.1 4Fe-4S binding protein [bacterium]HQI48701.1 4Fe-4S binding protein [bacterium]HQJ65044.1 4Fe-4S binding protein [bacterium]